MSARALLPLALACLLGVGALVLAAAPAGAAKASLTVAPAVFSPNGDGAVDATVVTLTLPRAARVTLGAWAPGGKLVAVVFKARALKAGETRISWNGMAKDGPLPNATYTLRATAKGGGKTWRAAARVTVDDVPPVIAFSGVDPPTLFAGGSERLRLGYTCGGQVPAAIELVVSRPPEKNDKEGTEVARVVVPDPKDAGDAVWDGRDSAGSYVAAGTYVAELRAIDAAGNTATSGVLDLYVFAPADVHGTVRDAGGSAVAGALVEVAGQSLSATTGADGSFTIAGCPLGRRTFTASKPGLPGGSLEANVNLDAGEVTIVLSRTGAPARSSAGREASGQLVLSGRCTYEGQDHETILPRAGIRVEIWDLTGGSERFIAVVPSAADGTFSYSYASDTWDESGRLDPIVHGVAQAAGSACARVIDGDGDVYGRGGGPTFPDNATSQTGILVSDGGDARVVWHMLDLIIKAHDRWVADAGWARGPIDVLYPAPSGPLDGDAPSHYWWDDDHVLDRWHADEIGVHAAAAAWDDIAAHEYGHAVMAAAYDAGQDDSAFRAYLDVTTVSHFRRGGRLYNFISTGDYDSFTAPEDAWTAFEEGWAEFFAAYASGSDHCAQPLECDYAYAGDGSRIIRSVARILWDLADEASSRLWYEWETTPSAGPRLTWLYGPGDDDRLAGAGGLGAGTGAGGLAKLWHVIDDHWPSSVMDLKGYLLGHAEAGASGFALDERSLDRIWYRMGARADIQETAPVVRRVVVTGTRRDGVYHGPVTVWCASEDYDTPRTVHDDDSLWARFLVKYEGTTPGQWSGWNYVAWTLVRATSGPPGESGAERNWFKATWDPGAPSPVQIVPKTLAPGTVVDSPGFTTYSFTPPQRQYVAYLGAVAFDGLLESPISASVQITVENSVGDGAKAPTGSEYIRYAWDTGVASPAGTVELWYKPWYPLMDTRQGGRIAEITFHYGNVSDPGGVRAATLVINGGKGTGVNFALNSAAGSPGRGTWTSLWSGVIMTEDRWYHIACQWGSRQMRLYVDGKLQQKDPYTGPPVADHSDGTLASGAVSLGRFGELPVPPDWTSWGWYKELRVSHVQRYDGNFTPAATFTADADTDILDHLQGSTIGENHGFTFTAD